MHVDEKPQLLRNRLFLAVRLKMARQTGRTTRYGQAIVSGQVQTGHQQIVELITESPITTIHGGSLNPLTIKGHGARVARLRGHQLRSSVDQSIGLLFRLAYHGSIHTRFDHQGVSLACGRPGDDRPSRMIREIFRNRSAATSG